MGDERKDVDDEVSELSFSRDFDLIGLASRSIILDDDVDLVGDTCDCFEFDRDLLPNFLCDEEDFEEAKDLSSFVEDTEELPRDDEFLVSLDFVSLPPVPPNPLPPLPTPRLEELFDAREDDDDDLRPPPL